MSSKQAAGLFEFVEEQTVGVGQLKCIEEKEWLEANGDSSILTAFVEEEKIIKVKWPDQKGKMSEAKCAILPAKLLYFGCKYN